MGVLLVFGDVSPSQSEPLRVAMAYGGMRPVVVQVPAIHRFGKLFATMVAGDQQPTPRDLDRIRELQGATLETLLDPKGATLKNVSAVLFEYCPPKLLEGEEGPWAWADFHLVSVPQRFSLVLSEQADHLLLSGYSGFPYGNLPKVHIPLR